MRAVFAAALASYATAGKVHDFFAETNFICNLCTKAVDMARNEQYDEIDALYELFPALQERFNEHYSERNSIVDLTKPLATCQKMNMCESDNMVNYFLGEKLQDLHSIVETINSNKNSSWTAKVPEKFAHASKNDVRQMMGTVVDPKWKIPVYQKENIISNDLPTNFDAREQWPECESVINHVRDQANCGSCWAHGTTEALNDRMCITSGGSFLELLSVSDTTACCNGNACFSFGCNGGQVGTPWAWFRRTGVVSGGDYGDGQWCYDYTMP